MLKRLKIESLGLFKDLDIEFSSGLNIISGESGAGKTMLLKSVGLISGEKADPSLIEKGANEAYLEAEFSEPVPNSLDDLIDEGAFFLARRIIKDKQSKALVSGRASSAEQLLEASEELIVRSDQHASVKLKQESFQLEIVDSFVDTNIFNNVANNYNLWQNKLKELQETRQMVLNNKNELEIIKADVELFYSVDPKENEEDVLIEEIKALDHLQELKDLLTEAYQKMGLENGANDLLNEAAFKIEKAAEFDSALSEINQRISSFALELQELSILIKDHLENYHLDNNQLPDLEERLSLIKDLKRRFFGLNVNQMSEHIKSLEEKLDLLENADNRISGLEEEVELLQKGYKKAAKDLTNKRKKSATSLIKKIQSYLAELNLSEAVVSFRLEPAKESANGSDKLTLFFQANSNVNKVAFGQGVSGGELSRLNLAIALAMAERDQNRIYIFDEIDAGISGDTAHQVGRLLAKLAKKAQVVTITHLAQIAVHADRHFLIEKDSRGANLIKLNKKGHDLELARLIGHGQDDQSVQLIKEVAGVQNG
jgi:DNA repair protein RecN (Recombination protein N)